MHVDDTFVAATTTDLRDEFETVVKSQFKITVKSDVDLYLGIQDYLPNGDVKITQPKLLEGLLEEYKDELANHRARVPITPQRIISMSLWTLLHIYILKERLSTLPIIRLLISEPPTLSILLVVILMSQFIVLSTWNLRKTLALFLKLVSPSEI